MTYKIDWEKVDYLLISGCPGTEVAGNLGIHPETLYRKVQEEKNMGFSEYLQQKRSSGKALIRAQQFAKALGKTEAGDTTLLIWLGKTSLEQREIKETDINNDDIQAIKAFAQQITAQKAVENVAESAK